MDINKALAELSGQHKDSASETLLLNDYMEIVKANPLVAASAHERIFDMINQQGSEPGLEAKEVSYNFFVDELFGMNHTLARIVGYFESAAQGHETRRRILLLWGPPGGAKSTIAGMLKRGLEAYSQTDRGALYALDGCPMHEEPLHLLPEFLDSKEFRSKIAKELGVNVEGQLCPYCSYRLEREFNGDPLKFPIRRIFFSEAQRIGIGTFEPSDPKSMSMEQLTGGLNFKGVEEHGSDNHPMALDWAGEFTKANRGLFEAVEFFKNPREFLFAFLSIAQERQFKVPKFGYISSDFAILAHSNETEFRSFMADPKNEALRDRLVQIAVPYNLRSTDEKKIYDKLLAPAQLRGDFHIAPNTLGVAAWVAVLSRLKEHDGLGMVEKMKLYDGREVGEWKVAQVPELKRSADHEGMSGLGPRLIINVLAAAATQSKGDHRCLNPIDTLRALREHIEQMEVEKQVKERWLAFITDTRAELDRELREEVQKAFVPAFGERAQSLLENYLQNVEAYVGGTKLRDEITGEEVSPDEKLMRAVEDTIGVSENEKDTFRQGVLVRMGIWLRRNHGSPLTYRFDDQMGRAIEGYLFETMKELVTVTVSRTNPDPEQVKRLNEVVRIMVEERGYCDSCANAALDYVGNLLQRGA